MLNIFQTLCVEVLTMSSGRASHGLGHASTWMDSIRSCSEQHKSYSEQRRELPCCWIRPLRSQIRRLWGEIQVLRTQIKILCGQIQSLWSQILHLSVKYGPCPAKCDDCAAIQPSNTQNWHTSKTKSTFSHTVVEKNRSYCVPRWKRLGKINTNLNLYGKGQM